MRGSGVRYIEKCPHGDRLRRARLRWAGSGPPRAVTAPAPAPDRRSRPSSGTGEDDQLLGCSGHRDVTVDRPLDAQTERLRVDEDDEVELEALAELRGQ